MEVTSHNWRLKVKDTSDYLHPKQVETDALVGVLIQFENHGLSTQDVRPGDFRFEDVNGVQRGPTFDSSIVSLGDGMDSVGLSQRGHYGGVWLYFLNSPREATGTLIWRPAGGSVHRVGLAHS